MSGETEQQVSGWTVDTLHSHIVKLLDAADKRYEQRFDAQEKAVREALAAADRAVIKAETAAEKRFDSVNEFRGQLKDQTSTMLTRGEFYWAVGLLLTLILGVAALLLRR